MNGEHDLIARRATEADLPAISSLLAELAREHGQSGDTQAAARVLTTPRGRPGPFLFVAAETSGLLGFAALTGHFPARDFTWGLTLTDLFVSVPHRAAGVGRALLGAVCGFAVGEGYTRIDNAVGMDEALPRHFYAALAVSPAPRHVYRLEGAALERLAKPPD